MMMPVARGHNRVETRTRSTHRCLLAGKPKNAPVPREQEKVGVTSVV